MPALRLHHASVQVPVGELARVTAFYREVFGGTLNVMTFGDMGTEGPEAAKVMHAQLETTSGYVLMGSDTPEGVARPTGNGITVSLSGDQTEEPAHHERDRYRDQVLVAAGFRVARVTWHQMNDEPMTQKRPSGVCRNVSGGVLIMRAREGRRAPR